jgi:diguanylate cyclase (GGDEF)-like protein
MDLDGFKEVNDEFGHAVGDALLKTVAGRLKASVRESDTVARTGGDEFVFIVRGIQHIDDTRRLANKLLASIGAPINVEGQHLCVGASIGIALYPDNSLHPAQLIRLADAAMYQVKQSGRNGYRLAEQPDVPLIQR